MEEEDREMASVIARSEGEHAEDSDKQQQAGGELSRMICAHLFFTFIASFSCPASSSSSEAAPFPEESIQRIIAAGFDRERAIAELSQCNGNAELALASLLAKSLTF